jgi:hypothetical protein
MSIKIPLNLIKYEYTTGKEFVYVISNLKYQGHYYEFNNKFYAGKEFNITNPEIQKITSENVNTLLKQASTYIYGRISNINIKSPIKVSSYQYNSLSPNDIRYFTTKINVKPTLIKEIDLTTYNLLLTDPLYQSVALSYINGFNETELNNAEQKIPGIKIYLENTYVPGVDD